jgi:hypothetical protein
MLWGANGLPMGRVVRKTVELQGNCVIHKRALGHINQKLKNMAGDMSERALK